MVTFTANYNFALPGVNDPTDANIWGGYLNGNWSALDALLATFPGPTLTAGHIYVGNASNETTDTAVTGDVTIDDTGVTTIGANKVTLGKLATQATHTILANVTAGPAVPTAATPAEITALANALTGYTAGAGTITGADSVLTAIQKLSGNITGSHSSSSQQSYANGTSYTVAHGLTGTPVFVTIDAVCQSPEIGFLAGQQVLGIQDITVNGGNVFGISIRADATNVYYNVAATGLGTVNQSSHNYSQMDATKWKLIINAEL